MSQKNKKILLIVVGAIVALAVCFGIGFGVANYMNHNQKKGFDRRDNARRDNGTRVVAEVKTVDDRTLTVVVGELEKSDEENSEDKTASERFVAGDETLNLTAPEDIDIDDISAGAIVMVNYNDDDQITRIRDITDLKGSEIKGKREFTVASIDSVDSTSLTVTLGNLERKEKSEDSETKDVIDPADNFVAGDEKLTLTVEDSSLVDGLKAGDIVTLTYSDDNKLESIRLLDKISKDGLKRSVDRSESKTSTDQDDSNKL